MIFLSSGVILEYLERRNNSRKEQDKPKKKEKKIALRWENTTEGFHSLFFLTLFLYIFLFCTLSIFPRLTYFLASSCPFLRFVIEENFLLNKDRSAERQERVSEWFVQKGLKISTTWHTWGLVLLTGCTRDTRARLSDNLLPKLFYFPFLFLLFFSSFHTPWRLSSDGKNVDFSGDKMESTYIHT